ncbi:GumC family protein [Selenomonas ruminantium]|uniref:GumC family protein n=1 Tax=Selenomonas ruminantium TaxID=971 RepID=UPI0026EE0DAF|nr:GumC family protein [Selenomonas ruminantium]
MLEKLALAEHNMYSDKNGELKTLDKEEKIDIGTVCQMMKERKKVCGAIIGGCTLLSLVAALVWPPIYESTTTVQTRSASANISSAEAAAAALGLGSHSTPTLSYVELMKSNTVLQPIIDELEWDEEDKKFLTPEQFAKKNLQIENTKQTNLIKVTAKGKTPEEAQMISQHVVDNFLVMMTKMNKETQSLLVQFLDERIQEAKNDADDARKKFGAYQSEHAIYSPEEQAKLAVTKLEAYDEAIGKMEVEQKANQAQADSVAAKLGDVNSRSLRFSISDNPTVQAVRDKIVEKEVEIAGLRQMYTDEHPEVTKAREELAQLKHDLTNEVNTVVGAKYVTSNPTQAALIKDQAEALVAVDVAKASEDAIMKRRDEKQKEMKDFPDAALEYMNLQRDAKIKEEIYAQLVKKFEQNKIQQAMDSMDIQIVDPATLPFKEKPVWPRPKLMMAIGFLIGVLLSVLNTISICLRKKA